jgi:hypothetical protein
MFYQDNLLNRFVMSRMIYDYTKEALERVSFDLKHFIKELKKAVKNLLYYEIEHTKKSSCFMIAVRQN